MNPSRRRSLALTAISVLLLVAGCSDRDPTGLPVARARIEPLVFDDALGEDVYFQPFLGTYINAVAVDSVYAFDGAASLRIAVPPQGSALGAYAGGVLTPVAARDLADFNALTFYARASVVSYLNEVGFGNDNTGESRFVAGRSAVRLTPSWQFIVVPIPAPERLIAERGLFTFAEGFEVPTGHLIWFDEIRFAKLGNISNPRPEIPASNNQYFVGATASLEGTRTTYDVDGADVVVNHMSGYFDFTSSNNDVAAVVDGELRIVGVGFAAVTAQLDTTLAAGAMIVEGLAPPDAPAPAPGRPGVDVISMFSDAYSDVPVDTWNTRWNWSTTEDDVYAIDGDESIMYSALNFVGIEFLTRTIDASAMTHLHLDVYAPVGTNFRVKVVAFDGDNGRSLDEAELTFDADSTPAFTAGAWSSLDIPLADFGLEAPWTNMGQLVLSTDDARLVLVDNVYWHR